MAKTSNISDPNEAALIPKTILRLRVAAVNLNASGDSFEKMPLRFSDLRMFNRRLLSMRTCELFLDFFEILVVEMVLCFESLFTTGALGKPEEFRAAG